MEKMERKANSFAARKCGATLTDSQNLSFRCYDVAHAILYFPMFSPQLFHISIEESSSHRRYREFQPQKFHHGRIPSQ